MARSAAPSLRASTRICEICYSLTRESPHAAVDDAENSQSWIRVAPHVTPTSARDNRRSMSNQPNTELDDGELLKRWRAGDTSAGQQLFERYYDDIQRFFMNKVSAGVKDLVQETFTACAAGYERVQDSSRFRSYLFGIAYNVLRDGFRKQYRRGEEVDLDRVASAELSPGPSTVLFQREEQRLLLEGLRRVPIADQVVLELHYWEQLTLAELAKVMDCPRNTVKGRVRRARERLKGAIEDLAHSPEVLDSTLTHLDDWAAEIRRHVQQS